MFDILRKNSTLVMGEKKRSREEFEAYLRTVLNQDYPKVKYCNPDSWRQHASKKK